MPKFSAFSVDTTTFTNIYESGGVIAWYSAVFSAEAAYTQESAIQAALKQIEQQLAISSIAGYSVSAEYLNETMEADIEAGTML